MDGTSQMFRTHSLYSPLFTSGFLFQPLSPSRSVSLNDIQSSPIYLDVEFSDNDQYRSFLSLDLAETRSTRSVSLKCKISSSKHTIINSRPRIKYVSCFLCSLYLSQCAAVPSEEFPVAVLCDPVLRPNLSPQQNFPLFRLINPSH